MICVWVHWYILLSGPVWYWRFLFCFISMLTVSIAFFSSVTVFFSSKHCLVSFMFTISLLNNLFFLFSFSSPSHHSSSSSPAPLPLLPLPPSSSSSFSSSPSLSSFFFFSSSFIFLISSNSLSLFSYSFLSIFRIITLNSLSDNSCISISLGSFTGSIVYCFDGVMFLILCDRCSLE